MKKLLISSIALTSSLALGQSHVTLPSIGHCQTTSGVCHDSTWAVQNATGQTLPEAGAVTGGSELQYATASENQSQDAVIQVPFEASSVAISYTNDVPPVYGGDVGGATGIGMDGNWPYVQYSRLVTVTSAAGAVLQQQTFGTLGPTPMANWMYGSAGKAGPVTWFGQNDFAESARGNSIISMTGGNSYAPPNYQDEPGYLFWGGDNGVNTGPYTYFPQLDTSKTDTITLSNIPAGASIDVHTMIQLFEFVPSSNVVTSTNPPGALKAFDNALAAQANGANMGCAIIGANGCMDTRTSSPAMISNLSSWQINYTFKETLNPGSTTTASSCPSITISGTYPSGQACSAPTGQQAVGYYVELYCGTNSFFETCQADGTWSPTSSY